MGPGAPRQRVIVIATFSLLTVQLRLGEFVEWLFGLGSLFIGRFTLSKPAAYQELATLLEKVE